MTGGPLARPALEVAVVWRLHRDRPVRYSRTGRLPLLGLMGLPRGGVGRAVQRGRSAFDDVLVEVAVDQVHVQAAGSTALGEFAGHRGSSAPAARTPGGYGDRLLLAGPARNAPTMARGDWTTSSML
ncbi:hypothetical protein GCM10010342_28370 [Streptomyces anulatus]|nr:hypothetical protein GCM10010342_28370 [Streptomyces anulatus]